MLLTPVTNCHTFSDPLDRDVLYGRHLLDPFLNEKPLFYNKIFLHLTFV